MKNQNKVVLITGAAKRIGRQTAITLHQAGFRIIVHYNQSKSQAEQLVKELNIITANSADLIQGDLNNTQELKSLTVKALDCFGHINVLINNASSFYPTEVKDVTEQQWDDLMGSNLKAPFFLSQHLANSCPQLESIVNMVDIHAERPLAEYSVYSIAKAGLVMMTKSLSQEFAPRIRVNGVAPGAILWHENDELTDIEKSTILNEVPLNRLGSPMDIADAILYLLTAQYVTGHILTVDGGRSASGGEKA